MREHRRAAGRGEREGGGAQVERVSPPLHRRLLPALPRSSNAPSVRSHLEASGTLDVHEEAVGRLHQSVQLVLTGLKLGRRVEKVVIDLPDDDRERTA